MQCYAYHYSATLALKIITDRDWHRVWFGVWTLIASVLLSVVGARQMYHLRAEYLQDEKVLIAADNGAEAVEQRRQMSIEREKSEKIFREKSDRRDEKKRSKAHRSSVREASKAVSAMLDTCLSLVRHFVTRATQLTCRRSLNVKCTPD
jgi:hypothetical protein